MCVCVCVCVCVFVRTHARNSVTSRLLFNNGPGLKPENLFITQGFLFGDICWIGFDLLYELCSPSKEAVWVLICSLASKQPWIGRGSGSSSSCFRAASVTGS